MDRGQRSCTALGTAARSRRGARIRRVADRFAACREEIGRGAYSEPLRGRGGPTAARSARSGCGRTGKTEQLGEMSASTPGAENVTQRPCDLDNCAVVLAIGTHDVAESVAQDDGGPGTYMPQGTYSAETASQPGVWDAYGVQKIIRVWDISVLPRDGVGAGDTAAQRAAISGRRSRAGQREDHTAVELSR